MRVSVVVSTYNQPAWLEKVLWGYAAQSETGFELVVADDGSGPATREAIERVRAATGLEIRHVWHEDRGFRKTEILNRAVLAATGDYLIFTDGDCIPAPDFVATHARLAEPGRFLSGGALRLPEALSQRITREDILSGRAFRLSWLVRQGWRPGRHALRLAPPPLAAALDRLTPTRATINGGNASVWREAMLAVNGFDQDLGYGGEDRALGERLQNLGLRGKQVRYRTPCLHLHHERPYRDLAVIRENERRRAAIRRERVVRARIGLAELERAGPGVIDGAR